MANVTCFSSWVINSYFILLWRIHCWWWNILNFITAAGIAALLPRYFCGGTVDVNHSSCLILRTLSDAVFSENLTSTFAAAVLLKLTVFYPNVELLTIFKASSPFRKKKPTPYNVTFSLHVFFFDGVSWKITSIILFPPKKKKYMWLTPIWPSQAEKLYFKHLCGPQKMQSCH